MGNSPLARSGSWSATAVNGEGGLDRRLMGATREANGRAIWLDVTRGSVWGPRVPRSRGMDASASMAPAASSTPPILSTCASLGLMRPLPLLLVFTLRMTIGLGRATAWEPNSDAASSSSSTRGISGVTTSGVTSAPASTSVMVQSV